MISALFTHMFMCNVRLDTESGKTKKNEKNQVLSRKSPPKRLTKSRGGDIIIKLLRLTKLPQQQSLALEKP